MVGSRLCISPLHAPVHLLSYTAFVDTIGNVLASLPLGAFLTPVGLVHSVVLYVVGMPLGPAHLQSSSPLSGS